MRKSIIAAACAAVAGAVLLIFAAVLIFDAAGIGGSKTPVDLKIAEGSATAGIADALKSNGIISSRAAFKLYSRLGGSHMYQMGIHSLNSSMSYRQIIKELEKIPSAKTNTITIPEGFELRQIADRLESQGLINRDVFMREVEVGNFDYDFIDQIPNRENRLEGYLFPDTYTFSDTDSEYEIINTMLANFNRIVVPVYEESGTDRSLDDVINLASVIEREAADDNERRKVASVFVNRLKIGMRLESCATVQYILKERKSVLSNADTQIDSPYNTYQNTGLPLGPIASPGLKSIEAALYPEQTSYLYFQAVSDGSSSVFSETFEEHLSNQRKIQGN